jgi:hypothetical protein
MNKFSHTDMIKVNRDFRERFCVHFYHYEMRHETCNSIPTMLLDNLFIAKNRFCFFKHYSVLKIREDHKENEIHLQHFSKDIYEYSIHYVGHTVLKIHTNLMSMYTVTYKFVNFITVSVIK